MKTFLFAVGLCAVLVACGDTPEKRATATNVNSSSDISLPSGDGPGPLPCDKVYVIQFTLEDGTVIRKEVPVYCSNSIDPDHGDPPYDRQYAVDPDPWDKQVRPNSETIREREGREQRQNVR